MEEASNLRRSLVRFAIILILQSALNRAIMRRRGDVIDEIIAADLEQLSSEDLLSELKDREVLVSGGAGFLGSWLCDAMIKAGGRVRCLDNFSTGLHSNIDHLIDHEGFRLVEEDVSTYDALEGRYDFILHFASIASPERYQTSPLETLSANSIGSWRMLELARRCDATILFASTSEVYGNPQVIPTPEHYWGHVNPVGVRSCYDGGKRFSEALFTAYRRRYGLDARIARIFNTYGPRLRGDSGYARVISRFILQALSNQDLTVYGDGLQTRSFCYIADMVRGLLTILLHSKAEGEIFNVGHQNETSILDLAHMVKEQTGSRSKITFYPLPEDDPRRRCPDVSKIRSSLQWNAEVGLSEGLMKTIAWFKRYGSSLS